MKKTFASLAVLVLTIGGVVLASPVAASADQPEQICEALDSGKIDTVGDPATVPVDAPAGKLIDGYCVKAGTVKYFIVVDPPAAHVVIDHPDKDSVSHYSLSYVDIVDVCPNIEGNQSEVPDGLVLIEGKCVDPPVDVCPNIEGNQTEVPDGLVLIEGKCVDPPVDVCPNIEGNQSEVPDGLVLIEGKCVEPPVDVCPNVEGNQSEVPDGLVLIEGKCVDPPVDVCPNVEGNQSEVPGDRILYEGECIVPLVAAAALISDPADCFGAQSIELGAIQNATWGAITDPPGDELDYSVTAFANGNARFPGNLTELTFTGSLDAQLDPTNPLCEVPTLDLVLPAVSKTDITCTTNGSYTLGAAVGFNAALLTWTVNGTPKASGTYPVTGATVLEIVASAVDPHALEPEWENPVTLTFAEPAATACDDLPTLAMTGASNSAPWGAAAVTMLLAGVVVLFARKRMTVQ